MWILTYVNRQYQTRLMGTKRHLLVRWAETSHTTWPGTNPNQLNHADRHINRWTDKRTDGQTLVQSRPLAGAFGITIKSTQSHEDTHSGSRPTPRHTPRKTPGLTHIHVYTFLFRKMCTILVALYLKLLRTLQPFTTNTDFWHGHTGFSLLRRCTMRT